MFLHPQMTLFALFLNTILWEETELMVHCVMNEDVV